MEPTNKTVGAVYCTYEDSGFLMESVVRIYPLVNLIVFLLNRKMWKGPEYPDILAGTFRTILGIPDPQNKFRIVGQYWPTEHDQRNYGLRYLRQENIDWCLVIDDDEFYNRSELQTAFDKMVDMAQAAYLFNIQSYWKRRDLVINTPLWSQPCLVTTREGRVRFNENRTILVYGDTWTALPPPDIVQHHMSYVRTDEQMYRKLRGFSHASEDMNAWYENVWLKWKEGEKVSFPGSGIPWSFIKESEAPYHLEPFVAR